MRKNILFPVASAICCIVFFNSCSKVANQLAQSIAWTGIDVTITVPPVSDTTSQDSIGTATFTYNLDSFIKAKTSSVLGMKNIDTLRFNSCTLTIQNTVTGNDFSNFVSAATQFNTSANTTTTNLGEVDNNPDVATNTLSLPINNTSNLRSYVPSSGSVTINYVCTGKLRRPTTVPINVNVHIDYYIHVSP